MLKAGDDGVTGIVSHTITGGLAEIVVHTATGRRTWRYRSDGNTLARVP